MARPMAEGEASVEGRREDRVKRSCSLNGLTRTKMACWTNQNETKRGPGSRKTLFAGEDPGDAEDHLVFEAHPARRTMKKPSPLVSRFWFHPMTSRTFLMRVFLNAEFFEQCFSSLRHRPGMKS
jgi:hypothetical protein